MPVLARERVPLTAEELMRSRYTAFVVGDIDWIMDSHHPDTVAEVDRGEVAQWSADAEWLGLKIRDLVDGGPEDQDGVVEFRARYRMQGRQIDHSERAHFERADGAWAFHSVLAPVEDDVELVPVGARATVGRNDPCTCGSGRKFKKCCGAA